MLRQVLQASRRDASVTPLERDDGGLIALGKDELEEMNVRTIAQSTAAGKGTPGMPARR